MNWCQKYSSYASESSSSFKDKSLELLFFLLLMTVAESHIHDIYVMSFLTEDFLEKEKREIK